MSTTSSRNFTTLYSGSGSVVPQGAYGNANVVSLLSVGTDGGNTVSNIVATGNITTTSQISAQGNITTAGYFVGSLVGNVNGNITAAGSNTQVQFNNNGVLGADADFTYNNGTNALTVTGNITGGNVAGTTVNATTVLATTITAATVNATTVTTTGNVAGGNITTSGQVSATGNITGGNILTPGTITATGNITAPNFIGNLLGNLVAAGTNTQVQFNNNNIFGASANFTFDNSTNALNVTGNITGGNVNTGGVVSATGNITGGNVNTGGVVSSTGNITSGNINTGGVVSATGNVQGGNIRTTGTISATGNIITDGYFLGNVANASGIFASRIFNGTSEANIGTSGGNANITIGGTSNVVVVSTTGVSVAGIITATGNVTGGNLITAGLITAVGNINGANLVASANLTSTQQTVVGTANTGTTGNIVVSGRNIATDMAYSPDGATGTALYTGRVMVGTGWLGNNAVGLGSRLAVMDTINRGNTGTAVRHVDSEVQVNLTGNVTNTGFRQQALGGRMRIGGGSAANTTAFTTATVAMPFTMAAAQLNLEVGNVSPYFLGNTTLSHATINSGVITLNGGSSIGNAYGFVPALFTGGSGASNATNYIGVASSIAGANVTGNLFCFYNGNATSLGAYGVQTANTARAATNYYFLRNDDEVAQVKLGSLRSYNEFQYSTATSGTVNIDKTNAQIQFIAPTANVTIGDYQNFVTTANDGTNNDTQTDTVTLIIQQGATPYTVTMPTGNASIKYASNVTTVGASSNSVTMVSITAIRSSANAALYLTTVSPEFI